jgi:hypothetical protein
MKHIAVFVALGLLSGCGAQGMKNGGTADAPYKDMLKKPLLADSIMRDGDDLSYQVHVTLTNNVSVPDIAQLQAPVPPRAGACCIWRLPGPQALTANPRALPSCAT